LGTVLRLTAYLRDIAALRSRRILRIVRFASIQREQARRGQCGMESKPAMSIHCIFSSREISERRQAEVSTRQGAAGAPTATYSISKMERVQGKMRGRLV
jgi:hypothetical protein